MGSGPHFVARSRAKDPLRASASGIGGFLKSFPDTKCKNRLSVSRVTLWEEGEYLGARVALDGGLAQEQIFNVPFFNRGFPRVWRWQPRLRGEQLRGPTSRVGPQRAAARRGEAKARSSCSALVVRLRVPGTRRFIAEHDHECRVAEGDDLSAIVLDLACDVHHAASLVHDL